MRNILSKINPYKKSKARLNAEYLAMRRGEKINPTICEAITAYIYKEYKWILGIILSSFALYIAYLKL